MNLFRALGLFSLNPCLKAQTPAANATPGKSSVFGETKTVIRDGSDRVTGTATTTATTTKPKVLAKHNGKLSLDDLTDLSDGAAIMFASHRGELRLRSIRIFRVSFAKGLAQNCERIQPDFIRQWLEKYK